MLRLIRHFPAVLLPAGIAVMLAGSGCRRTGPVPTGAAAIPVAVARAVQANVPTRLQAIGAVQTINTVSVKALVTGELKTVGFQQGDYVHRGQVLFVIDPQPYAAALAQAKAALARDIATDNLAQIESKRYTELANQGIVSTEQAQQEQSAADADAATVRADEATVNSAQINLGYCTITAPLDGRTGSLLVQPGNLIQSDTTVLVTINQISPIYVAFSVPQQYLDAIRTYNQGGPLEVTAQADGQTGHDLGRLSFINNTIDTTTGTIQLMATFPNTNQHLWPGEFVNTEVTLAMLSHVTVVPSMAVMTGQSGMYVYVVTPDRHVQSRDVTPGATVDGKTVIAKGLQPGEVVVTDGQMRLAPGALVQIQSGPEPVSTAGGNAGPVTGALAR